MGRIFLYQLSDIHIGSSHLGTESNVHPGCDGHHHATARELQVSITDARFSQADFGMSADDHRALLVSGDLTRIGSNDDFHQSLTFLGSQLWWHQNRNRQVETNGLNWAGTIYTVPGNHDHWKGFRPDFRVSLTQPRTWHRIFAQQARAAFPPAFNPNLSPYFFEPTPWHHRITSACRQFTLELFGVDSNSGLQGNITNCKAKGEIADEQLEGRFKGKTLVRKGLEQLLEDAQKTANLPSVAAIVCHHAFENNGGLLEAYPLSDASRDKLLEIARKFHVRAILTGHVHYFLERKWTGDKTAPHVWELQCGTTLQLDKTLQFDKRKEKFRPGYYLHQIELDPKGSADWNSLMWTAWQYRSTGGQFTKMASEQID